MPKESLKSYRPISLTCTDYKIGAGVIATRIQKVIKSILNTDQSAYIQGHDSFQTLRLMEMLFGLLEIVTSQVSF